MAAWREDIVRRLVSLKPLLSSAGDEGNQIFNEFVREHEWELALHVVCDHLLEEKSQVVPAEMLEQIESLHEAMGIIDTCVSDLRRK